MKIKEAVEELKKYVSKAHSRKDILNVIDKIFGFVEGEGMKEVLEMERLMEEARNGKNENI